MPTAYEPAINEVVVPVLNRDLCNEWLESLNVTEGMICAGYEVRKRNFTLHKVHLYLPTRLNLYCSTQISFLRRSWKFTWNIFLEPQGRKSFRKHFFFEPNFLFIKLYFFFFSSFRLHLSMQSGGFDACQASKSFNLSSVYWLGK